MAVVGRLVDVQVVHSAQYAAQAKSELATTITVQAQRGGIYDRNGALLAVSVPTKTVVADDFQVKHPVDEAAALAPLLGVPVTQLASELHQPSGYVIVAKNIPLGAANRLQAEVTSGAVEGLTLIDSSVREYPDGTLAQPVIGTTHASGAGASGLEYQYNKLLSGRSSTETLIGTPAGTTESQSSQTSGTQAGTGIELTLDEPLQYEVEQLLSAEVASTGAVSGTAIVMDVRSGDILAMANLANSSSGKIINQGANQGGSTAKGSVSEASQNLALTYDYEPGSVFKLITFSAALSAGLISPNSEFLVPDSMTYDGSTFHDSEPHPTVQLSATQILAQSSNIGTSQIAINLGENSLLNQVENLGFGHITSIGFPGESPGLLATASQWEPTNYVSLPIGQVDAVTAQQVLDAYNAVANGGVFVEPRLVRGTVNSDGSVSAAAPSSSRRVFSSSVDADLNTMLQQVITSGTGTSAVVPGYTVAGKTGTAQIPTPGKDSYTSGAYMASFVGFAPANDPVLSAIVVLNRPTPIYGGTVAAPVFSQIMSYALHRYDIPTTAGTSSQLPSTTGPSAALQGQDIT